MSDFWFGLLTFMWGPKKKQLYFELNELALKCIDSECRVSTANRKIMTYEVELDYIKRIVDDEELPPEIVIKWIRNICRTEAP